jgi:hypothetical protein
MMIHKSHSKKSLYEIIEIFGFDIPDYQDLNKKQLTHNIWSYLENLTSLSPDNEFFFIESVDELRKYLEKADQRKSLTVKQKNEVMEEAKEIIYYCKSGYSLASIHCEDHEILYDKVRYISKHGDLPTIRRAVKLFNDDPKMMKCHKIVCDISQRVKKKLEKQEKFKKRKQYGLCAKDGQFTLLFD